MKDSKNINIYETTSYLKKCWLSVLQTNCFIVYSIFYLQFSESLLHFLPCKLKPLNCIYREEPCKFEFQTLQHRSVKEVNI